MLSSLFIALSLTILIELGVLLLLGERRKSLHVGAVVVNVLTNVPLNVYVARYGISPWGVVLAEGLVVLVEALCYWLLTRSLSQACIYSLLCNAISFLIGLLLVIGRYFLADYTL